MEERIDSLAHDAAARIAASTEEGAHGALQAEGRAVLQAYVEEAAQLRGERGALRGELQAAVVSAKTSTYMHTYVRTHMPTCVHTYR